MHLRLRRGEDDDLIPFFAQAGPRQRGALKIALRAGQMGGLMQASESDEAELADAVADFVF